MDHVLSCSCIIFSHLVSTFFIPLNSYKRKQITWFSIHAFVNFVISYYSFTCVYYTLLYPEKSTQYEYQKELKITKFPMCLSIWIHIYHALFYNLSNEDLFHHVLFATLLPVPGYIYDWGIISNCNLFFICGLPGGLIYMLLAFQKCGYFLNVNEPYFSMIVNVFIRCPGILISSTILCYNLYIDNIDVPLLFSLIQVVLCPFNAIYYTHQSVIRCVKKNNFKIFK